jgi:phosphoribosylglycinamide formyltransferase 1
MADPDGVGAFRIGILASHGGSNFQAIFDRCVSREIPAVVGVVISNNSRSGAVDRARRQSLPWAHLSSHTHPESGALDSAILACLNEHQTDLVVLAGYMKKLGPETLSAYADRIINIHPALLPAFGGQGMYGERVHKAVLSSGARVSGATVHLVDEHYDNGPIIAQEVVKVYETDTADDLAGRVLRVEHTLYPAVVRMFAEGRVDIDEAGVHIKAKSALT